MLSDLLPAYVEAALESNAALLPQLLAGGAPKLRDVLALSVNFRVAGIGGMFTSGRFEPFGWRMCQSGRSCAAVLPQVAPAARVTSRMVPFFDAVAVADWNTAKEIASMSRRAWSQGEEYEEDFLFVELLMQHASLGASRAELTTALTQYEACLAGTEDARLPVLEALFTGDAAAFDERLTDWLEDRAQRLDAKAARTSVASETLATEWHLSVEGVALLRLAKREGILVQEEFPQVPAIALADPDPKWWSADWRVVEATP